jgi:DNA-binding MarR family transcriptional regulator
VILKRRPFPRGVEVKYALDMARYLPYRVHLLATKIASAPNFTLSTGVLVKARDWRILACLGAFGPLTSTEISEVVGMEAPTTSRAVQYLQENGLVMTRVSPQDRRKSLISLTAAGAAAHDEIAPTRREAGDRVESLLSPSDRAELYRILDKLDARLDDSEDEFASVWDQPEAGEQRGG